MANGRGSERVSSIIGDDDDDSLSILDNLGDIDPFEELNREPDRPSAQAARPAPSDPSPASDGAFERVQYYRALQGFLQALIEAAPLYIGERARNPGISDLDLQKRVAGLCKNHLKLIDKCLQINEADPADMMLRYQRRSLAKQIALLYRSAPLEEIEGLVDVSREWMLTSNDFDNAGIEYTSPDSMLNMKLALFTSALKAQRNLKGLWCSFTPSEVISKLQSIAMSLAKEVAFGWSKRSQISDQDNLFMAALPHCLEIAEQAYRDVVIKDLPEIEYIASDPEFSLPLFEKAVVDLDLGYGADERKALFERMRSLVVKYLTGAEMPSLALVDSKRWESAYIARMDELMSLSWNDTGDDFFEMLGKMDIPTRKAYVEVNTKIDLSEFMSRLMERLAELECPLVDVEVDFDRILDRARRHLAWVWGISDSLIAARNDAPPEDFE